MYKNLAIRLLGVRTEPATADATHRLAALHPEGPVLTQLVVQVVEVEAEGGRSALERHVEVGPQLRHVQGPRLPVCGQTKATVTVCNMFVLLYLCNYRLLSFKKSCSKYNVSIYFVCILFL